MTPTGIERLLDSRYRLDDRIGLGSLAEIWRGTDVILARPVAIKMLRAEHAEDAEKLTRFRAEARFGGTVAHENIARIYDCDEPGPGHPPFLIMELVDGPSLAELLADGPLGAAQAMDLVAQSAAGLAAAHRAGLAHGHIRPGCLLLARGSIVKITGFGRPLPPGASLSPANDLYDLGVVAAQCLASDLPRTEPDLAAAPDGHQSPPVLPAGIPAAVTALINELTVADPTARLGSAYVVSQRAAKLRDELAGGAAGPATGQLNVWRADPADTEAPGSSPDLAAVSTADTAADGAANSLPGRQPARRAEGAGGARRPRLAGGHTVRRAVLVAAGAAVLALAVIAVSDPGLLHSPAASGPARIGTDGHATVRISAAALDGHPVSAVRSRLRRLGLKVHVRWRKSDLVSPGLVLSVTPAGSVPVGSLVTVTGALSPTRGGASPGPGTGGSAGQGKGGQQPGHGPTPTSPARSDSPSPSTSPSGSGSPTPSTSPTAPASPPATSTPTPPASTSPTPTPTTTIAVAGGPGA